MTETQQKIAKFVQELLLEEKDKASITPSLILEKIDLVTRMNPRWGEGLDRDAVIDELIRRFSLWIGQDTTLQSNDGHVPWLNSARKRDWRYWQRYREWLERKLSFKAVEALDRSTDTILGLLEDPTARRALGPPRPRRRTCPVRKDGQLHRTDLQGRRRRLQDHHRACGTPQQPPIADTDAPRRGIPGIRDEANPRGHPHHRRRRNRRRPHHPSQLCHQQNREGRLQHGDCKAISASPQSNDRGCLSSRRTRRFLNDCYSWIRNHVANTHDQATGRKIVTHLPLLLIDDEADHASVDTGEQIFDDDGQPDEDHQPTAINRLHPAHSPLVRTISVRRIHGDAFRQHLHPRTRSHQERRPRPVPCRIHHQSRSTIELCGPRKSLRPRVGSAQEDCLSSDISMIMTADRPGGWMPQNHKNGHQPHA